MIYFQKIQVWRPNTFFLIAIAFLERIFYEANDKLKQFGFTIDNLRIEL